MSKGTPHIQDPRDTAGFGGQNTDSLFNTVRSGVKPFEFDSEVAGVFDDMIERSVPFYSEIQRATAIIAARVVPFGGRVYDLGCSTGTTLLLLANALEQHQSTIVGIDNSEAMLSVCNQKLTQAADRGMLRSPGSIQTALGDLLDFTPEPCSLIVLNYTLQFLPPATRPEVLARLVSALEPGAVVLLSEKVRHTDPQMHRLLDETHLDYKRSHGYSELEIKQKRDAIENVLVPLTVEENCALLREAGLASVELFAKCINFVTLVGMRKE